MPLELGDLALDPDRRQPLEPGRDPSVERRDRENLAVTVGGRLDLHEATLATPLEEDPRRRLVVAAAESHLDRSVQISLAVRELLGERKRKTGLHQHVEAPAFDFRSLVLWGFGDLGHEVPLLRSFVDEPCRSKFVAAITALETRLRGWIRPR